MTEPHALFSTCTYFALGAWTVLAVAPRWRLGSHLLVPVVACGLLSVAYGIFVALSWGDGGGFGSLREVRLLFESDWMLLAGWVHYLAFDLLVGSWMVREARRLRIPHPAILPCLAATLFAGPVGWILYLGVRAIGRRKAGLGDVP